MKTYYKREFGLIEGDDGVIFAAHGHDELYKKMCGEVEEGVAKLIDLAE